MRQSTHRQRWLDGRGSPVRDDYRWINIIITHQNYPKDITVHIQFYLINLRAKRMKMTNQINSVHTLSSVSLCSSVCFTKYAQITAEVPTKENVIHHVHFLWNETNDHRQENRVATIKHGGQVPACKNKSHLNILLKDTGEKSQSSEGGDGCSYSTQNHGGCKGISVIRYHRLEDYVQDARGEEQQSSYIVNYHHGGLLQTQSTSMCS